jgi:hypothetical protein
MTNTGNRRASLLLGRISLVFSMFVMILARSASAQTATYTYTGSPYQSLGFSSPTVCPLMGSFTTAQPIPPNSNAEYPAYPGTVTITSFSFTDCVTTITNLNASYAALLVYTGGQGTITTWLVRLDAPVDVVVNPSFSVSCPAGICTATSIDILSTNTNGLADNVDYGYHDVFGDGFGADATSFVPGTWTGGTSSCQMPQPSVRFYQGAAPAIPPNKINAPVTSYPPSPTQPVPQYFGQLPSPNTVPTYVLCPTIKSGCALSAAATMLTTFPNLITPTSLDSEIKAANGYDDGLSYLCPLNSPTCSKSMLIPYNDRCEMNWFAPQLVAPDAVDWIDGQEATNNQLSDEGTLVTVNQYLNDHVCGHQDRVILELSENVDNVPRGHHFIYVTGQNGSDWNVFDPGWQNVTAGTSSTLGGHIAGFTANGSTRTFTVAGVRTYRDITSAGNTGAFAATGNSPIELLVVDPQGRRLGNLDGTDLFEIQLGSYIRDFPLADPLGPDMANGDLTGIKTAHVSSPVDGTYQVTATGTGLGTYTLRFRSLGSNGAVQTASVVGLTNTGSTKVYQISISALSGLSGTLRAQASFQGTLVDISNSAELSLIDNTGIATALTSKILSAQLAASRGQNQTATDILRAFENQVSALMGEHITGVAPQVLLEDASSLISQLP